jgi:phosphatidate cytidylyltransferase
MCALWWRLSESRQGLQVLLWAAVAYWTLATLWLSALRPVTRIVIALSGLLALSFAWMALVRMRLDWEQGHLAGFYALLIVWLADSGAYFAGRQWGVTKLAPRVSPGKTGAGLWGGLAVCALLALGVATWRELPLLPLLAVTLVVSLYSVVGDLTESMAKRFAGVKDSGSLIPGHGGVLDRFDSLLAAAPLLMLGIELLPGLRG